MVVEPKLPIKPIKIYEHRFMSRNDFHNIKYIRFDMKTTPAFRLQADKFALVSEICYLFIEIML